MMARAWRGNVYLVGLRGAGKSSVGKRIAKTLNMKFVDQDTLVAKTARKPISRVFADAGEGAFRRLETKVLRELAGQDNLVVATGGGVVLAAENRSLMRRSGFGVYLHASPEVLAPRVKRDPRSRKQRPRLTAAPDAAAEMRLLYAQRDALYRQVASAVVDASAPLGEVVATVLAALDGRRWTKEGER